jgi:hypothetical protein
LTNLTDSSNPANDDLIDFLMKAKNASFSIFMNGSSSGDDDEIGKDAVALVDSLLEDIAGSSTLIDSRLELEELENLFHSLELNNNNSSVSSGSGDGSGMYDENEETSTMRPKNTFVEIHENPTTIYSPPGEAEYTILPETSNNLFTLSDIFGVNSNSTGNNGTIEEEGNEDEMGSGRFLYLEE